MNIERAKIAIDKMSFFIPEHILNDLYKDHSATAEILAHDDSRVVFSVVYHDKKDKRILSITVKHHEVNVYYNGTMQVFSHRNDESFFNDVVSVLSDVQPAQSDEVAEVENTVNQIKLAKELNELYIEFYNDFLTVECYARYKGYRLDFAKSVINAGRKINHNQKMLDLIYA